MFYVSLRRIRVLLLLGEVVYKCQLHPVDGWCCWVQLCPSDFPPARSVHFRERSLKSPTIIVDLPVAPCPVQRSSLALTPLNVPSIYYSPPWIAELTLQSLDTHTQPDWALNTCPHSISIHIWPPLTSSPHPPQPFPASLPELCPQRPRTDFPVSGLQFGICCVAMRKWLCFSGLDLSSENPRNSGLGGTLGPSSGEWSISCHIVNKDVRVIKRCGPPNLNSSRRERYLCDPVAARLQPLLWWALGNSGCDNTRGAGPDSWDACEWTDFSKLRLLHLPRHRKALKSLTGDIWFPLIHKILFFFF